MRFKRITYHSGESLLVKYYRLLRGLSQDDLFDLSKIKVCTISKIENGLNISRDTRITLAKALKVEPWQLCKFDDLDKLIADIEALEIGFRKSRYQARVKRKGRRK